jgi:hypothetical protein
MSYCGCPCSEILGFKDPQSLLIWAFDYWFPGMVFEGSLRANSGSPPGTPRPVLWS